MLDADASGFGAQIRNDGPCALAAELTIAEGADSGMGKTIEAGDTAEWQVGPTSGNSTRWYIRVAPLASECVGTTYHLEASYRAPGPSSGGTPTQACQDSRLALQRAQRRMRTIDRRLRGRVRGSERRRLLRRRRSTNRLIVHWKRERASACSES
jgi:hypothetical protein